MTLSSCFNGTYISEAEGRVLFPNALTPGGNAEPGLRRMSSGRFNRSRPAGVSRSEQFSGGNSVRRPSTVSKQTMVLTFDWSAETKSKIQASQENSSSATERIIAAASLGV